MPRKFRPLGMRGLRTHGGPVGDNDDQKNDEATEATPDGEAEDKPEWRTQLESHLDDAKAMGKDIKERLSGAGKRASDEAKETWKKLEPQLENAEKTLRNAADDAVESLQGMFGELKGQLGKLRDKL